MSCQLLSGLGTRAEDEEFEILPEAAMEEYSDGFFPVSKWPTTESLLISSRIAVIDKYRRGLFPWDDVDQPSKQP